MIDLDKFELENRSFLESFSEWAYLRNYSWNLESEIERKVQIDKIDAIKSLFYGIRNLFSRYRYVVFSNASERRIIQSSAFNVKVDCIIDELGKSDTLLVENPDTNHYNLKNIYTEKIVSRRFFDLFVFIFEKLYLTKKNDKELEELLFKAGVRLDSRKSRSRFRTQVFIFRLWFRIIKPKLIFLTCFYDKQYIIKAAKDLKIPVIDIQHGLIEGNPSAYYSKIKLDKIFFPDFFFSFGNGEKIFLKKNNGLIPNDNIFPVGSYYLEYLRNNFCRNSELDMLSMHYSYIVSVSLQWIVEEKLIDFILTVSKETKHVLYILVPRNYVDHKYGKYKLPENVLFFPSLDVYQIIMHSSYHCTVYSTCALEAPFFGVKNILVDIDGLSNEFLNSLKYTDHTVFVESKNDFIEYITNNKDKFKRSNFKDNFFVDNYKSRIKYAVSVLKRDN